MSFTKIVSSNNGNIINSPCTLPMLCGYETQGINPWLENFRIFAERKSHIVKAYVGAGGRRITEIIVDFAVEVVPV